MFYTGTELVTENKRLREFQCRLAELNLKYDKTIDDHKDIAELIGRINELTRFIAFIDRMVGD